MTTVCTARGVYARPHRAMQEPFHLAPDAPVPGRPFADPARSDDDLAALAAIRAALVRRHAAGGGPGRWVDAAGAEHWLVAPDWDALASTRPAVAVGFFGQARADVDHAPIVDLEHDILARAASFAGLLAYCNVRFADGQWGNLVLFADAGGPGHVWGDAVHADAIARTPRHYHSLRLHRASLAGGLLGEDGLRLERTSYYDFASDPVWRAVRLAA
jgi:hypothetical protein